MTGFGAASREGERASVTVELRSVNSRHLKLGFRLPTGAEAWEAPLRGLISERLHRGQVDASVRTDERPGLAEVQLDEARAGALIEALEGLRERYQLPGRVDLPLVASLGSLFTDRKTGPTERVEEKEILEVARRALDELVRMREQEGMRLENELRTLVKQISDGFARITPLIPERLKRERERLRAAVAELGADVALDEDRLAREIALIADRWDVSEEVVRAGAHITAFVELLEAPASEPVGKRLGFLLQELHREINTLGAKANDARITREVVEMKNALESLREQVENVE